MQGSQDSAFVSNVVDLFKWETRSIGQETSSCHFQQFLDEELESDLLLALDFIVVSFLSYIFGHISFPLCWLVFPLLQNLLVFPSLSALHPTSELSVALDLLSITTHPLFKEN